MSYQIRKSFIRTGGFAGFTLVIGQALGVLASRAPLPYKVLGEDGVLKGPTPMPASGVVQVELQTDEQALLEVLDFEGNTVFSEVVSKQIAEAGITTGVVTDTDRIDLLVSEVAMTIEEEASDTATTTALLGDGSTAARNTGPTVSSSDTDVATVAFSTGTVTVTGVAPGSAVITVQDTLTNGNVVRKTIAVTVIEAA